MSINVSLFLCWQNFTVSFLMHASCQPLKEKQLCEIYGFLVFISLPWSNQLMAVKKLAVMHSFADCINKWTNKSLNKNWFSLLIVLLCCDGFSEFVSHLQSWRELQIMQLVIKCCMIRNTACCMVDLSLWEFESFQTNYFVQFLVFGIVGYDWVLWMPAKACSKDISRLYY